MENTNETKSNNKASNNKAALIFIWVIVAISALAFAFFFLEAKKGDQSISKKSKNGSYSRSKRHKFPVKQKKQEIQNNNQAGEN